MNELQTASGFRLHVLHERFSVLRQPVVCARSHDILHHEWLVRFDGQTGLEGVIRPAEISGAIADLDISMLKSAISALNIDTSRKPIAVNLSGASFADPKFEGALLMALSELKTGPNRLIFELTETWDIKDLQPGIRLLRILRDRGHSLCLDDVGAGAASLRYLRAFPADWLKIDGDFIVGAAENAQERAVLLAVLSLRQSLGVKFIAEGIESGPLRDFATDLGIDALQGFLMGVPEPETAIKP